MPSRLPEHLPVLDGRGGRGAGPPVYVEREIREPLDLCDARGRLRPEAIGFARHPLWRANLRGAPLRKKRWNFWNVIGPDAVLSVTLAHLDYAAFLELRFTDLETGDTPSGLWLLSPGSLSMPEVVDADVRVERRRVRCSMLRVEGGWRVSLCGRAGDGRVLEAELEITAPAEEESLDVVVPWSERRFQLNSKHAALPCAGRIRVGERVLELDPARWHAVQDWGRGIWPRHSFWNWGVATGVQDGRRIGVNLGARWTTGTGSSENGILLDGRLTKIMEDLRWDYDPRDDRATWRVWSEHSESLDLSLTPRHAHRVGLGLGLLSTRGVCAFGRWNGWVRAAGERIEIRSLVGWAEEFEHRW